MIWLCFHQGPLLALVIGRGGGPTRTNLDGDFWEPLIVKKSQFFKNFFTKVMKLVNIGNES